MEEDNGRVLLSDSPDESRHYKIAYIGAKAG
jgi:hypothetical protein